VLRAAARDVFASGRPEAVAPVGGAPATTFLPRDLFAAGRSTALVLAEAFVASGALRCGLPPVVSSGWVSAGPRSAGAAPAEAAAVPAGRFAEAVARAARDAAAAPPAPVFDADSRPAVLFATMPAAPHMR
jgi:hypothetical protein